MAFSFFFTRFFSFLSLILSLASLGTLFPRFDASLAQACTSVMSSAKDLLLKKPKGFFWRKRKEGAEAQPDAASAPSASSPPPVGVSSSPRSPKSLFVFAINSNSNVAASSMKRAALDEKRASSSGQEGTRRAVEGGINATATAAATPRAGATAATPLATDAVRRDGRPSCDGGQPAPTPRQARLRR